MKIESLEGKVLLRGATNFIPKQIFECGQAFRWEAEEDGSYTTVAFGRVLNVKVVDGVVELNTTIEEFERIWRDYFDLDRNYASMIEELSFEETLKDAMEYGSGIRILNQDPFETIISFIISQNSNITRIKKAVNFIADKYGEKIDETHSRFPTPEELAKASVEDLREKARVGYRDRYIVESAQMISNGMLDMELLRTADIETARKELMKLPGVGPKVCDCILLFAFKRSESFPVDVWIKRVMEELYLGKVTPKGKIADEGRRI
ncbi:MAG: DNA glycosylase, partial [Peptoniphilus sp.]|uniref:DNA-3-methyladenine glycosylase family protein n=1 Tax=Peptoniphilus sp. TaxID=1971214 RepID=UPI002A759510